MFFTNPESTNQQIHDFLCVMIIISVLSAFFISSLDLNRKTFTKFREKNSWKHVMNTFLETIRDPLLQEAPQFLLFLYFSHFALVFVLKFFDLWGPEFFLEIDFCLCRFSPFFCLLLLQILDKITVTVLNFQGKLQSSEFFGFFPSEGSLFL